MIPSSLPLDVQKSFRYSRVRMRIVRALRGGPTYPADLARAARVDTKTLNWALFGHPPRYRRERALVALGLVRRVEDVGGDYYELTRAGRRAADVIARGGGAGAAVPASMADLAPAMAEE